MFDPITAALIETAPPLPGLDAASLTQELTAAYVEIASARLASFGADAERAAQIEITMDRMRRLADTYEGMVALGLAPDRHRAAAFVAASARQVIAQFTNVGGSESLTTRLDEDAIGAEIAAALLFLIAERPSDASEAARNIRAVGEQNPIRRALILILGRFARGNFTDVLSIDVANERLGSADDLGRAVDLLFRELLIGIGLMAKAGLGLAGNEAFTEAQKIFSLVRRLSVEQFDSYDEFGPLRVVPTSAFAGPHHLALLLLKASDVLQGNLLVQTPTPNGASEEKWKSWLSGEATRSPYLWENHRRAIATGYLHQGSSLVMTTPTGSGKTTLACLKVAATLASGKTVLYLAPTHALVNQVERDLNERIRGLATAENIEEVTLDDALQTLPDLAVVTPERCFALLTFSPDLFANVGLLVFDECHLLGVSRPATATQPARIDRRGVDAMLCLLTFMATNKDADYLLLSAMVSNGGEVACWLSSAVGRPVFVFDDKWKPTRQLRSCVVYSEDELAALEKALWMAKPPQLDAVPYGLFSLTSNWNPGAPDKLAIRAFANTPVPLKSGKNARNRWITANRYEVAARIAAPLAEKGLKVIVFCESIPMCTSLAARLNSGRDPIAQDLDAEQLAWRDNAISELGHADAIYDAGTAFAAVHHGELLPDERRLVEGLFRNRGSGINVLAATSTLAQGLNLPCDVVILAGTDRLDDSDPEEKTRTPLMPHEILNALGRAGRAGHAATGFAVVVPGKPIDCNIAAKLVGQSPDLPVVFSNGDQCLPLVDPLTTLFDEIEVGGIGEEEAQYLMRRLAVSFSAGRADVEPFDQFARRSFGFFQRAKENKDGADAWLASRKAIIEASLHKELAPAAPWHEELASKTGASHTFVAALAAAYQQAPRGSVDAFEWMSWLLNQLALADDDFDVFLRPDTLSRIFGRAYTQQTTLTAQRKAGLDGVVVALSSWFSADPLIGLEAALVRFISANEGIVKRPTTEDAKAKRARRFLLRLAPDLGFLCGLLSQVAIKVHAEQGDEPPVTLTLLPQLVRKGFRTPYHFAIGRANLGLTRPDVEKCYLNYSKHFSTDPSDSWEAVRQKVQHAEIAQIFSASNVNWFDKLIRPTPEDEV